MATTEQVITEAQYLADAYKALSTREARDTRLLARMSLAEVAELVGVDYSIISKWERRQSWPNLDHFIAYGRVLDIMRAKAAAKEVAQ